MHKIVLFLVYLTCAGHGWRRKSLLARRSSDLHAAVRQTTLQADVKRIPNPLTSLAMIFVVSDPAAAFSASGSVGLQTLMSNAQSQIRRNNPARLQQAQLIKPKPAEATTPVLLNFLRTNGFSNTLLLSSHPEGLVARELVARVAFLRAAHGQDSGWPVWSEQSLMADAENWLAPALQQATNLEELQNHDIASLLSAKLDDGQLATLEVQAPSTVVLPSGITGQLIYSLEHDSVLPQEDADCEGAELRKPVLAANLQEFFGFADGPSVGGPPGETHEVELKLLLSSTSEVLGTAPDGLAKFWSDGYPRIREKVNAMFPFVDWPEDPTSFDSRGSGKGKGRGRGLEPWTAKVASLPIVPLLPEIIEELRASDNLVLQAPPGAGKTTAVPLSLLDENFGIILMLQPRRVAARSAAARMAALLNEDLGNRVGYRIRLEGMSSSKTKVLVVTEGILLRRLQYNPELEGVDLVIFDEFHERSMDADMSLALCRRAQLLAKERGAQGPKILVMSATLGDTSKIQKLLGDCNHITSDGRCFPVEIEHIDGDPLSNRCQAPAKDIGQKVGECVVKALRAGDGDVLAFLPGEGEIRSTERTLMENLDKQILRGLTVMQLYGALDQSTQRKAIEKDPDGKRRVILATPIAESSLTIENVRIVVDAGLRKIAAFDHVMGISVLKTVPISQASATQRAGRAGRVQEGMAYRLWSKWDDERLSKQSAPEIEYGELSQLALDLAGLNFSTWASIKTLPWLTLPPKKTLQIAHNLLLAIGALVPKEPAPGEEYDPGALEPTEYAHRLVRLPLNPRLSHMLLSTVGDDDLEEDAVHLAAMLSDRYLMRGGTTDACVDVRMRLRILKGDKPPANTNIDAYLRAKHEAAELRRELRGTVRRSAEDLSDFFSDSDEDVSERDKGERELGAVVPELTAAIRNLPDQYIVGALLALAFPDRVGQSRFGRKNTFQLANGVTVVMPDNTHEELGEQPFVVAAALDAGSKRPGATVRCQMAAPISLEALRVVHGPSIQATEEVFVEPNDPDGVVQARRLLKFGALWLDPEPLPAPTAEQSKPILLKELRRRGLGVTLFSPNHPKGRLARELVARVALLRRLHAYDTTWPTWSEDFLNDHAEEWLRPALRKATSLKDLKEADLYSLLCANLGASHLELLEMQMPEELPLPSGTKATMTYSVRYGPGMPQRTHECDRMQLQKPKLTTKLHEFYGFSEGPKLGGPPGKICEVDLELQAPSGETLFTVSEGLSKFWSSFYPDIRRSGLLKYPKYNWPENPAEYTEFHRGRGKGKGLGAT